jgi:hypothetical protein
MPFAYFISRLTAHFGLLSQCYFTKQVFKVNKQIMASLALKINVNVGVQAKLATSCCALCVSWVVESNIRQYEEVCFVSTLWFPWLAVYQIREC